MGFGGAPVGSGGSQRSSGQGSNDCKPDNDCPNSILITWTSGLPQAPLSEPVTKKYNGTCLLTLGLVGKVGVAMAGNAIANKVPGIVARAGASVQTMRFVNFGTAAWTNPITTVGALSVAAPALFEHCECKHGH